MRITVGRGLRILFTSGEPSGTKPRTTPCRKKHMLNISQHKKNYAPKEPTIRLSRDVPGRVRDSSGHMGLFSSIRLIFLDFPQTSSMLFDFDALSQHSVTFGEKETAKSKLCMCVYIYIYIYIYAHTHVCVYIYIYIYIYVLCTCIYIYIYIYTCVPNICVYIYIYIYIYTYAAVAVPETGSLRNLD